MCLSKVGGIEGTEKVSVGFETFLQGCSIPKRAEEFTRITSSGQILIKEPQKLPGRATLWLSGVCKYLMEVYV
jgi:hypothetical protein